LYGYNQSVIVPINAQQQQIANTM